MGWFRVGYYSTWYAAFGALFAHWVGDHPTPLLLAVGCFVFAPVLLLGTCLGLDHEVFAARPAVVRAGRAGRRAAVTAGVLGAVAGIAATALAGGLVEAVGVWALLLLLAGPVVVWWAGVGGLSAWVGPDPASAVAGPGVAPGHGPAAP